MRSAVRTLLLTAALTLAVAATSVAKHWRVDDDKAQCPTAQFTTIQAAVNAAGPGDDIIVCNGTYPEDVQITGARDGLRVRANTVHRATVRSFAVFGDEDIGPLHVRLDRFVIEGDGSSTGIQIHDSFASALIVHNVIRNVGTGVLVDDARANVQRNTIMSYSAIGAWVSAPPFGVGAAAELYKNDLIGESNSTGVLLATGGLSSSVASVVARVLANHISGNSGNGFGIDVSSGGGTARVFGQIKANHVFDNGVGIRVHRQSELTLRTNRVFENSQQGILMQGGGNFLTRNLSQDNGGLDCEDQTHGDGTKDTANTWTRNVGGSSSPIGLCPPPH